MRTTQAVAPAKLIISGEHAVVYGAPALAMSIARHATTTLTTRNDKLLQIVASQQERMISFSDLTTLKQDIDARYQAYCLQEKSVSQVISHPTELLGYIVECFFSHCQLNPLHGLSLKSELAFPPGAGMGASAAVIVSLLTALNTHFDTHLDLHTLYTLAQNAEHYQHGKSSGLDCAVSLQGGLLHKRGEIIQPLMLPILPFYSENTGAPQATTGECVAFVRRYAHDTRLWQAFADITDHITECILAKNIPALHLAIRENHRLLCHIGVVPDAVQRYIQQLEKQGVSAKISGAGSHRGDNAGMLLLLSDHPLANAQPILGETLGAYCLPSDHSR